MLIADHATAPAPGLDEKGFDEMGFDEMGFDEMGFDVDSTRTCPV
jgi:hypothetical protein